MQSDTRSRDYPTFFHILFLFIVAFRPMPTVSYKFLDPLPSKPLLVRSGYVRCATAVENADTIRSNYKGRSIPIAFLQIEVVHESGLWTGRRDEVIFVFSACIVRSLLHFNWDILYTSLLLSSTCPTIGPRGRCACGIVPTSAHLLGKAPDWEILRGPSCR